MGGVYLESGVWRLAPGASVAPTPPRMPPYREPGERSPQPPPRTFRVTWWMKVWVRWARKPFYNRSLREYRCKVCGLRILAPNPRAAARLMREAHEAAGNPTGGPPLEDPND